MDWITPGGMSRRLKSPWGVKQAIVGVVLVAAISIFLAIAVNTKYAIQSSTDCHFPAIFNFGDSNSDTGGRSAAFYRIPSPYGSTFFGKPSGRFSDGRLIIDFIAEKLGLPYLNAYLDSIGTSYRHGANFATGGSTIQQVDGKMFEARFSPITLDVQLLQFQQFKTRTIELHDQTTSSYFKSTLPRPDEFSKALYTLDIGQNDLYSALMSMTEDQVYASIPNITIQFASAVEKLYEQGARAFWIHNTGPLGCLPSPIRHDPPKPGNVDSNGCVKSHNEVAQEFNRQLKDRMSRLRTQLPDAVLTYIDIYLAKYALISEAEKHGFGDPLRYCCGDFGDFHVQCATMRIMDGIEVYGEPCSNPSAYISWDGIHYTDAANRWIANRILNTTSTHKLECHDKGKYNKTSIN